jgi:hypothetical protein
MLCSRSIGCTRDTSRAPGRPPAPVYALLLGGAGPGGQGTQEHHFLGGDAQQMHQRVTAHCKCPVSRLCVHMSSVAVSSIVLT